MRRPSQSLWEKFKSDDRPLTTAREVKMAVPHGPGLASMYSEIKQRATLFGIPVLKIGKSNFIPRQRVIEKIEGRDTEIGE